MFVIVFHLCASLLLLIIIVFIIHSSSFIVVRHLSLSLFVIVVCHSHSSLCQLIHPLFNLSYCASTSYVYPALPPWTSQSFSCLNLFFNSLYMGVLCFIPLLKQLATTKYLCTYLPQFPKSSFWNTTAVPLRRVSVETLG